MKIALLTLMYISYFFYYYSNNNTISITVKDNYMMTPPENIYLNNIINGKIYFDFKNNSNIYCEKNKDIVVSNQIYNICNLYNCYYRGNHYDNYKKLIMYTFIICIDYKCKIQFSDRVIIRCTPKKLCDNLGSNYNKMRSFVYFY